MAGEEAVRDYLDQFESDKWLEASDGYQMLLENCGDDLLLPGLIRLTKHRLPEIRATVVSMLATRRPHTRESIEAAGKLLNDPDPLVRIKTLNCLAEFGEAAQQFSVDAYTIVLTEQYALDQLERVSAILFLLELDKKKWGFLISELHTVVEGEEGGLAESFAMGYLMDHYKSLDELENGMEGG